MADACESLGIKLEFLSESDFFMARFIKSKIILSLVEQDLNDRQKIGLEYAKRTGRITTGEFKRLCNISERQALDDLKSLIETGLLARTGSGRTTKYIPADNGKLRD